MGANSNVVKVLTYNSGNNTFSAAADITGTFGVPQDAMVSNGHVYISGSAGVQLVGGSLSTISNGGGAMAVSADGSTLFVARPTDAAINVYSIAGNGSLTQNQTLQSGSGLGGVGSLAISNDGKYLFAVGTTDNALLAFSQNTAGRWVRADRLVQDFNGVGGLRVPTSVVTANNQVIVASQGQGVNFGGLATFSILPPTEPVSYTVAYDGMASLTVNAGDDTNTVTVRDPLAPTVNINPGAGSDSVTLQSTTANLAVNVNLGNGGNVVDVYDTGSGSTNITGGSSTDTINLWGTGSGLVTATGNDGADTFRITTARIGGNVTVEGDNPISAPGDTLLLDTAAVTTSSGNLTVNGRTITFNGIEGSAQTVSLGANAGGTAGVYTIAEGQSLALSGSATGTGLSFSWDLNGDGDFGDASGNVTTVAWATLQSLGLGDNGTYRISMQVVDGSGNREVATATLNVTDTAPTLTVVRYGDGHCGYPLHADPVGNRPGQRSRPVLDS